jgi:hypothetical protein
VHDIAAERGVKDNTAARWVRRGRRFREHAEAGRPHFDGADRHRRSRADELSGVRRRLSEFRAAGDSDRCRHPERGQLLGLLLRR